MQTFGEYPKDYTHEPGCHLTTRPKKLASSTPKCWSIEFVSLSFFLFLFLIAGIFSIVGNVGQYFWGLGQMCWAQGVLLLGNWGKYFCGRGGGGRRTPTPGLSTQPSPPPLRPSPETGVAVSDDPVPLRSGSTIELGVAEPGGTPQGWPASHQGSSARHPAGEVGGLLLSFAIEG